MSRLDLGEPADLLAESGFRDFGSCRGLDPDLFFPERGEPSVRAKQVCGDCIVRDECLRYALDHNERYGIWGGTSERERRRLRRDRRQAAA